MHPHEFTETVVTVVEVPDPIREWHRRIQGIARAIKMNGIMRLFKRATHLMIAAYVNNTDAMEILLEAGANPKKRILGMRPIHYAALGDSPEAAKILVDKEENIFLDDVTRQEFRLYRLSFIPYRSNVSHIAAMAGSVEFIDFLPVSYPRITERMMKQRNSNGENPLDVFMRSRPDGDRTWNAFLKASPEPAAYLAIKEKDKLTDTPLEIMQILDRSIVPALYQVQKITKYLRNSSSEKVENGNSNARDRVRNAIVDGIRRSNSSIFADAFLDLMDNSSVFQKDGKLTTLWHEKAWACYKPERTVIALPQIYMSPTFWKTCGYDQYGLEPTEIYMRCDGTGKIDTRIECYARHTSYCRENGYMYPAFLEDEVFIMKNPPTHHFGHQGHCR